MDAVRITIPFTPPSVNGYVRHSRGRHYVTRDSIAFKEAIAFYAIAFGDRRPCMDAKRYAVTVDIYQAKGERGDIDNYPKCVLDGLKGVVFKSDAMVKRLLITLDRDVANPRTEITVEAL